MNRLDALIRNNRPSLLSRIVSWVFGADNKKESKSNCELTITHTYPCDYEYGCYSCPHNCKSK